MSISIYVQPIPPGYINDEIFALVLQLEELKVHTDGFKGKHKMGSPPDQELAASILHLEIQSHIQFLNDLVFTHSLASAVDSDARIISTIVNEKSHIEQDRQLAISMDGQPVGDKSHYETEQEEFIVSHGDQV
jgi:hypothetical protein